MTHLKQLNIHGCDLLERVLTFSTLESLRQLQVSKVKTCKSMKVIVKNEMTEQTRASMAVVFRHLKSLELDNLPNLVCFFSGTNDFHWPLLDDVIIKVCPKMMVFTSGKLIAPQLKYIHTGLGIYSPECYNLRVTSTWHQVCFQFFHFI